uniref:glutathione-specific gamma-glutamylcyclotransferase n=1 Tax=Heliothis virescens TaxID=7102 RepID=A0A2A4K0D7_HELVI
MWVFGYGSLVWKVDFKYECKVVGYIKGYLRRFYQHSIDHRGVPGKPGRVVTLVQSDDPNSKVWGVAYKIRTEDVAQVTKHLDFREKNGYVKKSITFHPTDSLEPFQLTLYVATEENESYAGYIKGYLRRFYQHSIDHRGVPGKPGRVVTLVQSDDPNSKVWGVAYKIRTEDVAQVTKHLDFREKNGYVKKSITFHPTDSLEPFQLTLYVATEENESYAGEASIEEIAQQVISCQGPSGPNKEYVYNLAAAMRELTPDVKDDHLFELEAAVRRLDPDTKKT